MCFRLISNCAGPRLLHDRIDRQTLRFGDFINVVDEGREGVHFLELEGHRRVRVVGEALRRLQYEGAIRLRLRHVELELDSGDRRLTGRFERRDLSGENAARIDVLGLYDRDDGLRMVAGANRHGPQRARENAERNIGIASLPQPARFLDAVAARHP